MREGLEARLADLQRVFVYIFIVNLSHFDFYGLSILFFSNKVFSVDYVSLDAVMQQTADVEIILFLYIPYII